MANVFEQLDREWQHIAAARSSTRRLRDVCDLAGVPSIAQLERYVRSAPPEDADRILVALVTRALGGEQLAARVLLQLLLPGTRNLARRWWALGDADERAAAAVAAVYHRIRTYPLERRPGRIAANVLLDAARELRRSVPRVVMTPTADPAVHSRQQADRPSPDAAAELAEVLTDAVDAGVLDLGDAQLIARSRIAGHRVEDIAAHHRLGTRALWDRRQRAERRLAAAHTNVA
jgi:hypothetical protein